MQSQLRSSAPLHIISELAKLFAVSNCAALTARQRGFGAVHCCQNLHPAPFAFLPQQHGLLYSLFFLTESAGLDGIADKRLLVFRKVYFHDASVAPLLIELNSDMP